MSDFSREIGELHTHTEHVSGLAQEVGATATSLASGGVGPTEMYGILVGQIAHPILSHVADSKSTAITELSNVLDATVSSLRTATQIYADTETDAADKAAAVETEINSIPLPGH